MVIKFQNDYLILENKTTQILLYFAGILYNCSVQSQIKKSKNVSHLRQQSSQSFGSDFNSGYIFIKGARLHNLKNIDIALPKNKFIVVTGVSGSGKSSLIIDTLFAEGQRRYVESLSSYARQFLMRMNKPEVDFIRGICPAIAIEQKVTTRTSRSTVGSLTEIYDHLKLLFARAGKTYSPVSGKEVTRHTVSDVVDFLIVLPAKSRVHILIPFNKRPKLSIKQEFEILLQKGFSRFTVEGNFHRIEDFLNGDNQKIVEQVYIVIDRFVIENPDQHDLKRFSDSVQTAFTESHGDCIVEILGQELYTFSNRFELDGIQFEEPSPHLFSFNNPYGACTKCEGFGSVIGIDHNLVIPNHNLSVYEDAISCWRGEKMSQWKDELISASVHFDFPIHRAIKHLTDEEYNLLWTGNRYFKGLHDFFRHLEEGSYKIQYRVMLSRYRGKTSCPECGGTKLRKEAAYVKINGKSISDLVTLPINKLSEFFDTLELSAIQLKIAQRILVEIQSRLTFMKEVGLGYLTLNRLSNSLSGGESQRINLTRSLGSNLTNSLYILDEPSIGLHPKDTKRLIGILKKLRNLGNTVVVIEHDEEIMHQADHIVDMGPMAGQHGGEIIAEGDYDHILQIDSSLTSDYLSGRKSISLPATRRKNADVIEVKGATQNNLKNINALFPLHCLTAVSGLSGSGKTTLVKQILYRGLHRKLTGQGDRPGSHDEITGAVSKINQLELIDQNPIGKSSRSNPVTYVKAYDVIRDLFARQQLSLVRGYKSKHFSFNVEGGRCEACKGEGETLVEMQFLADIHLECEECKGKRFKTDILEVTYNGKNIHEVLELTVDEAIHFFGKRKEVVSRLKPLSDVGLGYIHLGQSSSTLSGGEAQRVKLASFLGKGHSSNHILFLFDEPTTGLHFHDINKLLDAFNALIEKGHSIIVIEHNMEIIKSADWVIDLGPGGGDAGGEIVYQGKPEGLITVNSSLTAPFLQEKLAED